MESIHNKPKKQNTFFNIDETMFETPLNKKLLNPVIPSFNTNQFDIKQNNADSFHVKVQTFVKENKPYIYILTPCFGSINYVNYTISLMNTINMFREIGIPLQIVFCKSDSLVSRARNNLIAKAMNNPETTHILFIDNDITWDPLDILKLLLSEKPLIGGIYPLKRYNWNKLINTTDTNVVKEWIDHKNKGQLKNVSDEDIIQHRLLNYNVNYLEPVLNIEDNIAKVRHIATGFMMIQRNTIEKMFKSFPYTKYTDDVGFLEKDENKYAYALFDCGVEDDHYFSEDWLFCHRWTKMGGNVYLDVSINLRHTGIEDFNGSYITSIL